VSRITIINEHARVVEAMPDPDHGTFLVDAAGLPDALGWELKASGLCRDSTCVPVADTGALRIGERLDLAAVAAAVGQPVVVDLDAGVMAVALPAELRRRALEELQAPAFELPDLEGEPHRLGEWAGKKKLLVTLSSWCGCRYDLPGWQALHDELAPEGFSVIAVAIDHSAADILPFAEGLTMPILYDPHHVLTELYAISNVPTVVWIDEDDRIVRPNGTAFGSDAFRDFTGVEAGPHLDEVGRWVREGVVPIAEDEARQAVGDLSDDEVLARLHFRVAAEAHRQGNQDVVRRHLARASELAPDDLTIWRAGMPLVGEDPFGDVFFERYEEWKQRGSPFHGLPAVEGFEPAP
jgi:peroxiredoxin